MMSAKYSESAARKQATIATRQKPQSENGAKSGTREGPVRKKGQRTRENLLDSSQRVFERVGFLDARVADVVKEAKVSHGSFYTYFDSKEDAFREVAERVVDEMYRTLDEATFGEHALELIRAANQVFVEVYEQHAAILALIEQVATFDDHFRAMRLELRRRLVRRVERAMDAMVEAGEATIAPIDRHALAAALAGMVDNFAYTWFVLEEPMDRGVALATLDEIWVRTLLVDGASS